MNAAIQYRDAPVGMGDTKWLDGTLVDHAAGVAIKTPNGNYVTLDRNGTLRESATIGPWETFQLDPSINVLRIKPEVVAYALEIHEA